MSDDRSLHVFRGEEDWVVAYDSDDCWLVWEEQTGETRKDYDFEWTQLSDDALLKIYLEEMDEDGQQDYAVKTNREWCIENGRGFLCSEDY